MKKFSEYINESNNNLFVYKSIYKNNNKIDKFIKYAIKEMSDNNVKIRFLDKQVSSMTVSNAS